MAHEAQFANLLPESVTLSKSDEQLKSKTMRVRWVVLAILNPKIGNR